ncbi:SdrD B-like domain-containing protein [Planctomycetes bacterium TBK1r]|uniref:SD-repeat containing protein B domain-containing protein n=1 Tax=Stieleria magnilauensis TaxID=2527963 RepID=A0ABX5XJ79_9BACT|nr:hypothetical protein TBK1r_07880 [Planctomycetes bacterium TBK1r]
MKRRFNRIESLEKRNLLAAGLIPVNATIPIQDSSNGLNIDGDAVIKFNAVVLDPHLDSPDDVNLTNFEVTSNAQLSGQVNNENVSGSYSASANNDALEILASGGASILQVNSVAPDHLGGSIDATIGSEAWQAGIIQAILDSDLDLSSGGLNGTLDINLSGNVSGSAIDESFEVTISQSNVVTADFPDPSLKSVSGRVFLDADGDGVRSETDLAVDDVTAVLLDGNTEIDSVNVDADGFYSFYNLGSGDFKIRIDGLGAEQEFSPVMVGADGTLDSNIDPTTGTTASLDFSSNTNLLNIDAGVRAAVDYNARSGLIPIDVTIPFSDLSNGLEVDGDVVLRFDVTILDPKLDDASDISLTNVTITSNGGLDGQVNGQNVDGTFEASAESGDIEVVSDSNPMTLQINSISPNHINGTFSATVGGITVTNAEFNAILNSALDFASGELSGTLSVDVSGNVSGSAFDESFQTSFTQTNVVSADFPDPSQQSVSGRVFVDVDGDGVREDGDVALTGVTAVLLDGDTEVASMEVDANGHYSFYNLSGGDYRVRIDGLDSLDQFSPLMVGGDVSIDSDIDPNTGATAVLDFSSETNLINIDAGVIVSANDLVKMDTVGLYQGDISLFHLNSELATGASVDYTLFGPDNDAGWIPLAGDWDGDGTDTVGLYQPSTSMFHLVNSLGQGTSDQLFAFGPSGNAGWIPLAGDWDGDGVDTIGLYQPDISLFHLKNSFGSGSSDIYAFFGPSGDAGWTPLAGDWNGDGTDTIGLYQPDLSLFHLSNSFAGGASDIYVAFGASGNVGWTPLVGDWNGDKIDTIGLYQPDDSIFHLIDTFRSGASDYLFAFGPAGDAGWTPLTGDWDGATLAASAESSANIAASSSAAARPATSDLDLLAADQLRAASALNGTSSDSGSDSDDEESLRALDELLAQF